MSDNALVRATMQLPCSVVVLSAKAGNNHGAMTATAMFISQVPPLLVVSVSKTFATYQLIEKTKEFAVNIIADDQLELAERFGITHGYEINKFREHSIATEQASKIDVPLISKCFANMECRIKTSLWEVEGNHAIYIAEVVAFKMNSDLRPLIWLNGRYFKVGTECHK
jgi:flavin reductase (DIM6/NTAB) family NADH-FMN oxidoreductase RutF